MIARILAVFHKELRLLARDRMFLVIQAVVPAVVVVLFGSLFTITLREVPVTVADRDGSARARQAVRFLETSPYFLVTRADLPGNALDRGTSMAAVLLAKNYGDRRRVGADAPIQVIVDGTDAAAAAAQGYLEAFLEELAAAPVPLRRREPEMLGVATWFNPDRRDTSFFLPGVIMLVLFSGPAVYCAVSLVREKVAGTWDFLGASPIANAELLAGKILPYVAQALAQAGLLVVIAVFVFGVPLRGSPLLLLAGTALFVLSGIGLGGLFAASSSTEDGVWRWVQLFLMLPGLVLSGFIYPLSSMPWLAQALSYVFPARSYLELMRGVMLKGAGAAELAPQLVTLAGFAAGCLGLALYFLGRSRRVE